MEMRYFWVCDKVALEKKILLITRVNTTLGHIILLYAHGIYMRLIHPWFYRGQADLALSKGVLELSLKGMYVTYLCLEYLYARVLRHIRYTRYLITTTTHTEFLRTVFLVA
jgi:hypothetical protein